MFDAENTNTAEEKIWNAAQQGKWDEVIEIARSSYFEQNQRTKCAWALRRAAAQNQFNAVAALIDAGALEIHKKKQSFASVSDSYEFLVGNAMDYGVDDYILDDALNKANLRSVFEYAVTYKNQEIQDKCEELSRRFFQETFSDKITMDDISDYEVIENNVEQPPRDALAFGLRVKEMSSYVLNFFY